VHCMKGFAVSVAARWRSTTSIRLFRLFKPSLRQ